MIFKVKKDKQIFEVDDLIVFSQQGSEFRQIFNTSLQESGDNFIKVEFDNATAILYTHSNRLLINPKEETNADN